MSSYCMHTRLDARVFGLVRSTSVGDGGAAWTIIHQSPRHRLCLPTTHTYSFGIAPRTTSVNPKARLESGSRRWSYCNLLCWLCLEPHKISMYSVVNLCPTLGNALPAPDSGQSAHNEPLRRYNQESERQASQSDRLGVFSVHRIRRLRLRRASTALLTYKLATAQ